MHARCTVEDIKSTRAGGITVDITTAKYGPQAALAERVARLAAQGIADWTALSNAGTTVGNPTMRAAWQEAATALIKADRAHQHDLWRAVADEHGVDPFGGPVQSTLLGILAMDLISREAYETLTEPWRSVVGDKDVLGTCCMCEECYR